MLIIKVIETSVKVVDYISSQDGGETFYHGLVEDRSLAL